MIMATPRVNLDTLTLELDYLETDPRVKFLDVAQVSTVILTWRPQTRLHWYSDFNLCLEDYAVTNDTDPRVRYSKWE